MKILYHHRTASKDGQSVHIEELIEALRAEGHIVRVVAPKTNENSGMGTDLLWVHRLKAKLPKSVYELLEIAYSLVAYLNLARTAREFKPDFIYERYNLFLFSGLVLKWRFRIPLVLEINAPLAMEREKFGGLGMPWLARWAEAAVWRGADIVLPVTQVLAEHVIKQGVSSNRVTVIHNGINEVHFSSVQSVADAKTALGISSTLVLGFTGFIRDWHGVDRIIRWMSSPQAPADVTLLVVGDGPARMELERLASELFLERRVIFTGVIPREKVPQHIAAFDIALQPAVVPYASPLKLFEYLALGKAILAPRSANIQEILTDRTNALLFDPATSGAMEDALTVICNDEALRKTIANGSAATINRLGLTWNKNANRVTKLVEGFLARSN